MKIKKFFIFLFVGILLFQDTIEKITEFSLLTYVDELLVVALLICSIINIIIKKKINKKSLIIILLIVLFSAIGLLSNYINSSDYSNIFIASMGNFLTIKFFIIIFALMNLTINEDYIKVLIDIIVIYGYICAFFAIINFIFPNFYERYLNFGFISYRFNMVAVCSLFDHPGKYGWFMLFVAVLYLAKFNAYSNKKDLIKFIIFALSSILSLRTKVIISVIIVLMYQALFLTERTKAYFKKIIAICIVLIALMFAFRDILINTYKLYFTTENGVSARMAMNMNSLKIAQDYFPLGVGFGKYGSWIARDNYSEYYYKYDMDKIYGIRPNDPKFATDTFWPSIIGETGILGTIIYIALLIIIYRYLLLYRKKIGKDDKKINFVLIWGILTLIQTLCESFGEPSFTSAPQYFFVALIIGIGFMLSEKNNEKEKK